MKAEAVVERSMLASRGLLVAASIVAISAIHLLRQYMTTETYDQNRLLTLTAVHLAFVVSALLLAYIDKMSFKAH